MTDTTDTVLAFVNGRSVQAPRSGTAEDAVRVLDPVLAERLAEGHAYLTDGRGIRIEPAVPISPGDIIRVVVSARRPESDADA